MRGNYGSQHKRSCKEPFLKSHNYRDGHHVAIIDCLTAVMRLGELWPIILLNRGIIPCKHFFRRRGFNPCSPLPIVVAAEPRVQKSIYGCP